jgi:hypothetical protein
MLENIGSAMLILGSIWLHYAYGLEAWITVLLCIWGLFYWLTVDESVKKDRKQLTQAKTDLIRAKTRYYERKSQ